MSHSHSPLGDPAIKLFGRNIPFPDSNIPATHQSTVECLEETKSKEDDAVEKSCERDSFSELDGKGNGFQDNRRENEAETNSNGKEDLEAESDKCGKEKALQKPDKLIPCPRCNSLETKFCYFNNYNVNQPRHFCKNCHRYWTAGGTIRNVPVGAGRRRNNKHSSSQSRQVTTNPDTYTVVQRDTFSDDTTHQPQSDTGLPGLDSPICESMESKLNLKESKRIEVGSATFEDCFEEPSPTSCSSVAATSRDSVCQGNEDSTTEHGNPMQCYPVPQWAYPWNPSWNFMMFGANNSNPSPSSMGSVPMMTVPGFCAPNIPFQFVPGSYWGYMPSWEAGKWVSPVLGPNGRISPSCSTTSNSGFSGNNSPTLGKHSRDASSTAEESTEKCLWVPKTLRIDDPNEAAKSSIWSTLGIEPDRNGFVRSGVFKPFKQKPVTNSQETDTDQVLQSNPAALSRSNSFQEST